MRMPVAILLRPKMMLCTYLRSVISDNADSLSTKIRILPSTYQQGGTERPSCSSDLAPTTNRSTYGHWGA